MFQQVVRWTFIITIWKKYKGQLLTIIGYLASLWLVSMVHDDYLEYVSAAGEGNQTVGASFAAKWLAYIVFTVIFYWVFQRVSKSGEVGHQGLGFLSKFRGLGRSNNKEQSGTGVWDDKQKPEASAAQQQSNPEQPKGSPNKDPFANIRNKETLRSEADLIFELKGEKRNTKKGA
ncbi:hypothetical protein J1N51_00325 [Psychrosphaera ytuae]|uniref:Uncharacterized protein n=1 Tax=Psychrosphaera ytuae TaxID=2820710 RepID=A0A975DB87_9GAMM|nr:hypothetical protein [Psychrosphaera ytuae]QTH63980.1 hypothetical protein J1N51_00325 [Psychrosphaera ytuae]